MSIAYLIDTDWVIDHLHGVPEVGARLRQLRPQGLTLSVISLAELYEGVYGSRNPEEGFAALEAFLSDMMVLGIDDETCRIFGRERDRLRREGTLGGDFDLMIAATALRYNLTLLTNNRRHFEMVSDLRIESQS